MEHRPQGLSDTDRATHAAGLLEVTEFQVFERAHLERYRREGEIHGLEQAFARYLYFGTVPAWVRHYTRTVSDRLDDPGPDGARTGGPWATLLRLPGSRVSRLVLS